MFLLSLLPVVLFKLKPGKKKKKKRKKKEALIAGLLGLRFPLWNFKMFAY